MAARMTKVRSIRSMKGGVWLSVARRGVIGAEVYKQLGKGMPRRASRARMRLSCVWGRKLGPYRRGYTVVWLTVRERQGKAGLGPTERACTLAAEPLWRCLGGKPQPMAGVQSAAQPSRADHLVGGGRGEALAGVHSERFGGEHYPQPAAKAVRDVKPPGALQDPWYITPHPSHRRIPIAVAITLVVRTLRGLACPKASSSPAALPIRKHVEFQTYNILLDMTSIMQSPSQSSESPRLKQDNGITIYVHTTLQTISRSFAAVHPI